MEGLFFMVDPIWWISPIEHSSLYIALIIGIFCGVFFWKRGASDQSKETIDQIFHIINPEDPEYRKKTLGNIRSYLSHQYQPHHSWAHITRDIRSYTNDTEILNIIDTLENLEYSGKTSSTDIYLSINNELHKKFKIKY